MSKVINAFDPTYIKTHYPNLLKDHVMSSKISIGMSKVVEEKRAVNPNHGRVRGVTKTDDRLLPKTFAVYSREGMPK